MTARTTSSKPRGYHARPRFLYLPGTPKNVNKYAAKEASSKDHEKEEVRRTLRSRASGIRGDCMTAGRRTPKIQERGASDSKSHGRPSKEEAPGTPSG
ncbi:hypothetical protein WA026_001404 [Henosepilachna vigintioctopunctata]|uniref:Uncharacterized protein n=1 Tax=Henosepilachna vigintioctopunctata TaxID=420089 RepID=A0AAW1UPU1_9CUCU